MILPVELWIPIDGFENYEVSNYGRVKSLERTDEYLLNGKLVKRHKKEKYLKPGIDSDDYLFVRLYNSEGSKEPKVHQLVAKAFLPNYDNLPVVNHKDENTHNNCVENLEWCDIPYNNRYGTRTKRAIEKEKVPIEAVDKDGNVVLKFECGNDARRAGYHNAVLCCRGIYKTCGGYKWRYSN